MIINYYLSLFFMELFDSDEDDYVGLTLANTKGVYNIKNKSINRQSRIENEKDIL